LTATVSGPGLISVDAGGTKAKSATVNSRNGGTRSFGGETVIIYSDGTAGTMTITYKNSAGTTITTQTVTFTGAAASIAAYVNDTVTVVGKTITLKAQIKDAGGNLLSSGTFYVFSSDTNIVSSKAVPTTTTSTLGEKQTSHACSDWTTPNVLTCTYTVGGGTNGLETGTATVTLRDSWNVTAASVTSNSISQVVTGKKAATVTVAFDKATYAPGERAVITITAKDVAGTNIATSAGDAQFSQVVATPSLTEVATAGLTGTQYVPWIDDLDA